MESSTERTGTLYAVGCVPDPDPIREQGGQLEEGDVASSSQFKLYPREKQQ